MVVSGAFEGVLLGGRFTAALLDSLFCSAGASARCSCSIKAYWSTKGSSGAALSWNCLCFPGLDRRNIAGVSTRGSLVVLWYQLKNHFLLILYCF